MPDLFSELDSTQPNASARAIRAPDHEGGKPASATAVAAAARCGSPAVCATRLAVRFDGRVLRAGDTGTELATLGADGVWRTPDGIVTEGLEVPEPTLKAAVSGPAIAARNRELDAAWLDAALVVVEGLARKIDEFTTDEVWERLEHPPREGRLLGALMHAAKRAGLIDPTDRHRPSRRPNVNRRPVRVWRSLVNDGGR
jgi:hypothetical protein